jgi:hypothetical protein
MKSASHNLMQNIAFDKAAARHGSPIWKAEAAHQINGCPAMI